MQIIGKPRIPKKCNFENSPCLSHRRLYIIVLLLVIINWVMIFQ
uniref:Uncharacterized protein n=1 Tax=Anguilla anguilla TaxID=7936 RepID=A0A0E9Q785_ANGAN